MKVTIDSKKGLKTNLKVFVDKKTIEEKINSRLAELKETINLKGFRPGKVPIGILKKQFGKVVYGEVLEKIIKDTSAKAIEEKKIKVIGPPKIDVVSYGEGKDLNYNLEAEELPSMKIKPIEEIKINSYDITITKKDIDKRINDIAKNQNNFVDKKNNESSRKGDLVVFDYQATIDQKIFEEKKGENTQIIIGKDLFINGFDKQLIGVLKNQEKDVSVVLPTNYPKKEFANKKAIFKCKILNIKKPETIKVDDDFAKNLGAKDLNDLKELITKQIQSQYNYSLDTILKKNILDHLEKVNDFKLPDSLVQQELALISKDLKKEDQEKNKQENEKIAKRRIKLGLILNEFGTRNNIKVDEHQVKTEIQKQIQSMPGQSKQVLEYYKKNPSASETLKGTLYEEKIINLIKQKAKNIKKTISIEEAELIIKNHSLSKEASIGKNEKEKSVKTKKALKKTAKIKKIRKK